jgi:hypothetical protein
MASAVYLNNEQMTSVTRLAAMSPKKYHRLALIKVCILMRFAEPYLNISPKITYFTLTKTFLSRLGNWVIFGTFLLLL